MEEVRLRNEKPLTYDDMVRLLEELKAKLASLEAERAKKENTLESKRNVLMKVKWKGENDFLVLTHNKIYDVISIEKGWYRIVDDSGEDYLYPPKFFEVIEE